jgi:hypothetical protein
MTIKLTQEDTHEPGAPLRQPFHFRRMRPQQFSTKVFHGIPDAARRTPPGGISSFRRGNQAGKAKLVWGDINMQDRLDTLFQMQDALNRRIGVDASSMTDEERVKWVLNS